MNIRRVQQQVYERFESTQPRPRVVLVDVGATVDATVTVMDVWLEVHQYLVTQGAELWIARVPPPALEKARKIEFYQEWQQAGQLHETVRSAVARFEEDASTDR